MSLLLALLLLAGCQASAPGRLQGLALERPAGENEALLSLFLHLDQPDSLGLWMEVTEIELVGEQLVVPLTLVREPAELAGPEIGEGQRFLARGVVPAGVYDGLRLRIGRAARLRGQEKLFLATPEPEQLLPLPGDFRLRGGESRTLFLAWKTEDSLRDRAFLVPALVVQDQAMPLLADLAYVSAPELNTIFLLRTDHNRVCGSLAIPGGPTRLAFDARRELLYVLAAQSGVIHVVEAATSREVDRIRIPMVSNPSALRISSDGLWAYILDEGGDDLLRLDLLRGGLDQRVRLGYKPRGLVLVEDWGLLAVASALSQEVYLLDPETLAVKEVLAVGSGPDGLLAQGDYLYVAESGANTVGIFNLRSGRASARVNTGFMPRRLVGDSERIYVSNHRAGTVSLLAPRQQRVLREIPVGALPLEMAISSQNRWVYVAEQGTGNLAIIDQATNRVVGQLELGTRPEHLLVIK
ncbi:YncE family protein [Desulfurivibrio sp. D14AmB]|uniref:YncE family protein n=1 Tax=Desulfurivibrio sp. D14AmB TaxID=3374370 RepID=UPI00376EFC28